MYVLMNKLFYQKHTSNHSAEIHWVKCGWGRSLSVIIWGLGKQQSSQHDSSQSEQNSSLSSFNRNSQSKHAYPHPCHCSSHSNTLTLNRRLRGLLLAHVCFILWPLTCLIMHYCFKYILSGDQPPIYQVSAEERWISAKTWISPHRFNTVSKL